MRGEGGGGGDSREKEVVGRGYAGRGVVGKEGTRTEEGQKMLVHPLRWTFVVHSILT